MESVCHNGIAESVMASLFSASQTKRIPKFLFENECVRNNKNQDLSLLTSPLEGIVCEFGKH